MVTKIDYEARAVHAARSVLLELTHLLGAYHEDIVLVGGWVPELLLPSKESPHVGSTDVDLALNHRSIEAEGYETILKLLKDRGYEEGPQPFIFFRKLVVEGQEIVVQVDLLAGEYEGATKKHRHQKVQDVHARKARGCDLAFEHPVEIKLEGYLPDGGKDSVTVRVASIVPFIVMKGMALADRMKEKDAWDIYYCLKNYPGGLDPLVDAFKPFMSHGLVKEGLEKIAEKFASEKHVGPKFVADFEEISDAEERALLQRDAFERAGYLLMKLDVK
ncbi:MAG: nucleotidyl transferase AbiEii/AbiGii toxin family protein [Pseudomonadota bacterium]